jgi:hypothetical protein
MLRKIGMYAVLSLIVVALTASVALAARSTPTGNAQFKSVDLVDNGNGTVNASGLITGLGSDLVTLQLITSGTAFVDCTNKGGQLVEAQAQTADASTTTAPQRPENGRLAFNFTSTAPTELTTNPCPNGNWTYTITSIDITSATLNVIQNGETVLTYTENPI